MLENDYNPLTREQEGWTFFSLIAPIAAICFRANFEKGMKCVLPEPLCAQVAAGSQNVHGKRPHQFLVCLDT